MLSPCVIHRDFVPPAWLARHAPNAEVRRCIRTQQHADMAERWATGGRKYMHTRTAARTLHVTADELGGSNTDGQRKSYTYTIQTKATALSKNNGQNDECERDVENGSWVNRQLVARFSWGPPIDFSFQRTQNENDFVHKIIPHTKYI